jgi:adenylate cyclase
MQAAVARLNQAWIGREDRAPMHIGIGLHHGFAMVGNVGHPQRMEFTVLGDVVNVASRLESANRQLGTGILVSATVRDLLAPTHRFLPLGPTLLKGKREAVGLFTPLGLLTAPAPAWLPRAEAAQAQWFAGNFAAAADSCAELAAIAGPYADFFCERAAVARSYAQHPPAGWTGTYRLDTK